MTASEHPIKVADAIKMMLGGQIMLGDDNEFYRIAVRRSGRYEFQTFFPPVWHGHCQIPTSFDRVATLDETMRLTEGD